MSQLASDNFTRADNVDLGTAWDPCTGESSANGLEISGNTAIPSSSTQDSSETNNSVSWPNDQYAELTFFANSAAGVGAGIGVTCRAATGATVTYYRLVGDASGYELGKKVTGTFTSLSSASSTTFAANDVLRLELQGTTWRIKKNNVQFDTNTDSSIASGRAGIAYSSTDASARASLWTAGSIGSILYWPKPSRGPRFRIAPAPKAYSTAAIGVLAGTDGLTFGQSGTLTGAGALAGTATLTFGQSGAITGAGALAGSSGLVFGQSGALQAAGGLSGSSGLVFGQSGLLSGSGALQATGALLFDQSGTLTGAGALSGTAPMVFGASATADQALPPVVITETAAGHRTRRTVYIVRIDGQEFQCFSLEQVQELLDRAKAIATTVSQQIIATPETPKPRLPRIRTAQPEIKPLVQKAEQEIRTVYRDAFVTAEIRILFELAQREEDDTLFWLM